VSECVGFNAPLHRMGHFGDKKVRDECMDEREGEDWELEE